MKGGPEEVRLFSGSLCLEGRFRAGAGGAGVVICHPHPRFGGSMDNNVVEALERFCGQGLATLCFNFRGAGRSEGEYDNMIGETDDVIAALSWLGRRPEINAERLALAGYSFGGLAAVLACLKISGSEKANRTLLPRALVLVSPMTPPGGWKKLAATKPLPPIPALVVNGDQDPFCPLSSARELVQCLGPASQLAAVKGADHFYAGRENEAGQRAADFLLARFKPAAP